MEHLDIVGELLPATEFAGDAVVIEGVGEELIDGGNVTYPSSP